MIRQNKSQKIIMFSKDISKLPKYTTSERVLPIIEDDQVYPRVFPSSNVPLKVAITRRQKQFEEYDLNEALKQIQWKYSQGLLDLKYYNYQVNIVMDECNQERIKKGQIRGRAFDIRQSKFKDFVITQVFSMQQQHIVKGFFQGHSQQIIGLDKFYVCLSFQDPDKYSKIIKKSSQTRQQYLICARFNFYIDNIDLQDAPEIPKFLLTEITKRVGVQLLRRDLFMELNEQYKRTMNQILFINYVINDNSSSQIKIPKKQYGKAKQYKPKNKIITLMKDNKKFKLVLKSLKTKTQEVQSKSLFFKNEIVHMMQHIKNKIQQMKYQPIFDLKQELHVMERFVADNLLMVGYFNNFMETHIIEPVAHIIRKNLIEHTDGWFKIYQTDKNTYLMSKLRRLFILVQQNIKNTLKEHIKEQIIQFSTFIKKRMPILIKFTSFNQFTLHYQNQSNFVYEPMIIIEINISNSSMQMTIKKSKLREMIIKNINNVCSKLNHINTPQTKALVEVFVIFKDQYGIDIEIPQQIDVDPVPNFTDGNINNYHYDWIKTQLKMLVQNIDRVIDSLVNVQNQLNRLTNQFNLSFIINDSVDSKLNTSQIIQKLKHYMALYNRVEDCFNSTGVNFGLFYLDYKMAKTQLIELIQQKIGSYKSLLIRQYQFVSNKLQAQLVNLANQINEKPRDIYHLVQQRQKLQILQKIIEQFNQSYQIYLYELCEVNSCYLSKTDSWRRWSNTSRISQIINMRAGKKKQYQQIRKVIMDKITIQQIQIDDILKLFKITLANVMHNTGREKYIQNYNKLEHLKGQYHNIKKEIQDIRYKEIHLQIQPHNFQLFDSIQTQFVTLYNLWEGIYRWEISKNIWYKSPFNQFQIQKPDQVLTQILGNMKKIQKTVKQNFENELFSLIGDIKIEIDHFQDKHLRLLKILKKKGFNKRHLQKIGIFIDEQVEQLTLMKAIQLNFLQKIDDIQAVSNDAWNQFYLQQTLNRVYAQLTAMKYDIIHYLDKKGNQIPLINNYSTLNEISEQVILDLQSVLFNPMRGQFQKRIQDLFDKSIYIQKSIQVCHIFQKKFIQLHPIFDSTDVVKQLPTENKQFTKILRNWVEMLKYMKKIVTVYDSCNGQNIHQKVTSMLIGLEKVKVGLSNYLQQKRQGFNRFYLLTDQQLYQLFASTNDMNILSKHISKLFHSVTGLKFDQQYITAAVTAYASLNLINKISYKKANLQEWLSHFERGIKLTITTHLERLIKMSKKWTTLLGEECSQALLLSYQIQKTFEIQSLKDYKKLMERQRNLIRKLVDLKKGSKLTIIQMINLGSLLVLALFYSEKINELIINNVTDSEHFQLRKMLKIYYNEEEDIKITSFQTNIGYGYEYLGLVKRLVLTNLTERMQLIYMSAIKYSLGGSAIGPAGTGKSQTTKDIARICGKGCLIYNCSESLGIDVMIKILKGMAVTGLWICFDQFNRLHFQVLNMVSEQLSIIFKYKAMGMKLDIQYDRQVIAFKSDFHLCITYNPTYVGRQNIPKSVTKHFRTVAMVNCDKKVICKLLFYSKGFKQADELSQKLNRIFQNCQNLWFNNILYDFGLRSLISIIELAGNLYKGEGKGHEFVIHSIKVLVLPRLTTNHRNMLLQMIKQQLGDDQIQSESQKAKNEIESEASRIRDIISVRLGIILLGQIFTGKTTTMEYFQNQNKDFKVEHIHINSLSVQQIYGQTNSATRIWKEGYLTKIIRQYFNRPSNQKLIIYIKGVIFSQWIQNLNSVLDNSRSLSLSSGQIIYIPDNIKFIISCSHLEYASPATISRSCLISFKKKKIKDMIQLKEGETRLRNQLYDSFEEVIKKIRKYLKYEIDEWLLLHWTNKYVAKMKMPMSIQNFWHILSLMLEGQLQPSGKNILDQQMKKLLGLGDQIYSLFWDGKAWKKIKDSFGLNIGDSALNEVYVGDLIIKNLKYKKIQYFNKLNLHRLQRQDILLLIGKQNTGKSSIVNQICQQIDKRQYLFAKINLTRKMKNYQFYNSIDAHLSKKSNKRKGILHGKELILFLDDVNLPQSNKYKYKQIVSFLQLLLQKKGCYNYNTLEFQHIEDMFLIANHNTKLYSFGYSKQFMKCSLPIFVDQYNEQQISHIFKGIIDETLTQLHLKDLYIQLSDKLIEVMKQMSHLNNLLPNYLSFHFIHFKKIIVNILLWNINEINGKKEDIKELFVFETQRMLLSRMYRVESMLQVSNIIQQKFQLSSKQQPIFHILDRTINGTVLNTSKCQKIVNLEQFYMTIQYICDEYILSKEQITNQSLVVFPQLCLILTRMTKGISQKRGNISIVGLPKCGKKILVQLCNYLIHGKIYKPSDRYDQKNWYETIKSATKDSHSNKCPSILLLEHSQMKQISQKQQLNTLLKTVYLPSVYSQADYEQLIYTFQSQLIKNKMATNKQNTIKIFIKHLQDNLKIVLLLNPARKQFKEDIIYYPAIAKHTQFYWIAEWPTEALMMIAQQAILDTQIESYLPIFPQIHQLCKRITISKTSIPIWQGLYLDFLKLFNQLYEGNHKKLLKTKNMLERSFNIIRQTEIKLQSTRDEIKRLQPAILILQKQAIKTIKSLNIQKSNAEMANDQLMKKQIQCNKIIKDTQLVKQRLSITNTRVEEQLSKAWQNVYLVKQSHIAEIKSLMNPSELIKIVITAILIIVNQGDIQIMKNKSQDGLSIQENYFQTGKRYILSKDSKQITKILTQYKKEKLTKQKIAMIEEKCLNHPRWNIIEAKNANKAIFYFFLWVEAVVKYFKLFQETVPLREELNKATALVHDKNKEIEIVKKQLGIYVVKIQQLSAAHKQKTERLHQYTNKIILYQKMLNRGYQILRQIQSQKQKWMNYQQTINNKFQQNLGNSIMCSSLIIYNSTHSLQIRNQITELIKQQLKSYSIIHNAQDIFWFLQSDQQIVLKELGIYHNHYILNNLKIIENTGKLVFIIDPEEEGLGHLKNRYKLQNIMFIQKIDYKHANFRKTLQNALSQGLILFVQITGLYLPHLIEYLIDPKFRKNQSNGNTQILLDQKYLVFNSKFKIYLFTTTVSEEYSIELISKVTTVNFAITLQQLEEKIINLIIAVQFPEENEQLQELNKTNIKDNIELKSIQNRILAIFANMTDCEDILKTQEILQILSTSNRLHKQIQQRIQNSNQKRAILLTRRQTYRKKSNKFANLYFKIQKLSHLSPLYQYSFNWFISLLKYNINCFNQVLSLQLSKGLPAHLKIIPSLIIAQNQYTKINFGLLFNQQTQTDQFILKRFNFKVSMVRLQKIVANIRLSGIDNLQILCKDYPQKLALLFTTKVQDIMTAIPDEFSSLQFFQKIMLINCFRPDCTVKLLKDWLDINLGSTYNIQITKIMQNTINCVPILVYEHSESLTSSTQNIYKLFDTIYKDCGKSICYISGNNCGLERIKMLMQSGLNNDQWIVIEGMGEQPQELTNTILLMMEQSDFKRKDMFRLWLIINEYELKNLSQKLIKLCNKIVFQEQIDIIKRISTIFSSELQKLVKFTDPSDLNKKKYMLNELCLFHYMMNQKYKYKQKLWNQPISFYETDLDLNLKYLYLTQTDQLKKLYPNIVTNIIYGGKVTDQQDIQTISLHIQEALKNTVLERNIFWQTVWADDKFPKNQQEHQHYLRTVLNKVTPPFKNIQEQYGISSFVANYLQQRYYRQISLFYNATRNSINSKEFNNAFKQKIKQIYDKLFDQIQKLSKIQPHRNNPFLSYLLDEQLYYQQKLNWILAQFKQYIQLQENVEGGQLVWCQQVMNNRLPSAWRIKTILALQTWLEQQIQGLTWIVSINQQDELIKDQIQIIQVSLNRQYPIQLVNNFATLCLAMMNYYKCTQQTHALMWEKLSIQEVSSQKSVKVTRWYLWNAIFEQQINQLKQGTIQENYYSLMPKGKLKIIEIQQLKKYKNYKAIPVYHHSFQYGDTPNILSNIWLPVGRNSDKEWLKRMRVHLTLTL